jgi:cation diffusion facilitator family transporter
MLGTKKKTQRHMKKELGSLLFNRVILNKNSEDSSVRARIARLEGWISIIVNLLLFASKLVVGILINSIALIADAVHSVSDVVTSFIIILGYNLYAKPGDIEHPYGHERIEYVSSLIMAILLGVAGLEFIRTSVDRFDNPTLSGISIWVLIFVFLTIVVKIWLGLFAKKIGRKINSKAVEADSIHHYTDAISSMLVLIAFVGAKFGYLYFDAIGGIAVGVLLIWSCVSISKESIDSLLGTPPSPELIKEIKDICLSTSDVLNVHDVTVHSYGDRKFITAHVEVDQKKSTDRAHEIADLVEKEIEEKLNAYSVIHVDPVDLDSQEVAEASKIVKDILKNREEVKEFHDLRIVKRPYKKVLILDIVPEESFYKNRDRSLAIDSLINDIKTHFPDMEVKITVDPIYIYN